jgi:hypothetical protein
MRQRIAAHQGDFLLVQPVWEKWAADKVLPDLGLDFDLAGCRPIQANLDNKLELCTLRRVAAP